MANGDQKSQAQPQKKTSTKPALQVDQVVAPAAGLELAWEAPEFKFYKKDIKWLLAIIALALGLGVFFFWQKNYSAMLVTLAGAFVFYSYGQREPKVIRFTIDEKGFYRGEELIPWEELKSYWINILEDDSTLYLETTARFINFEKIHLENVADTDLNRILGSRLPQKQTRSEEFFDRLTRFIKF